jgi:hypothetical protein
MPTGTNPTLQLALLAAALALAQPAAAQINCVEGVEPLEATVESRLGVTDFIREVAAKEAAFSKAFARYTYTLDVSVQTLQGETVDGELRKTSRIDSDAAGARRTTVLQEPVNTLTRVKLTDRDVDALRDAFVLTTAILADRDIVYAGRQKVGNIDAAVFDILPRTQDSGPHGFIGRTWVRQRGNAIIRICGRVASGPFGPMRYSVERMQIADQYWFPATIRADEDTEVDNRTVHVRVTVKYSDYTPR